MYFDIKRDIAICEDGGFFCQACVVGKPAEEQSPDPRYCQGCYELLSSELGEGGKWRPHPEALKSKSRGVKKEKVSLHHPVNMSILKDEKPSMDIIPSRTPKRGFIKSSGKRGRKKMVLPLDLIRKLSGEGLGSQAITTRLKGELGIAVSYKTIQRVLSGEGG